MEINDISVFLAYYSRIKQRTRQLFPSIPPDKIEWTYKEGKFTFGDIIRHLAAIERYMYAENVQQKPSSYKGCGTDLAKGYKNVLAYYEDLHRESLNIFSRLDSKSLRSKCTTPGGIEITTWKWLRAMTEHEIHHRGQLYTYLGLLGIKAPPIFGLTSEEVADKAISS